MLQDDCLFPWLTIYENCLIGLKINKTCTKENMENVKNLLTTYGLKDFLNNYPKDLSGGMRQRVALIRTLALKPDLLLLDEPFSALDYQTRISVSNDVCNIIKNEKKTLIIVTHDISEAITNMYVSDNAKDADLIKPKLVAELKKKYTSLFFPADDMQALIDEVQMAVTKEKEDEKQEQ